MALWASAEIAGEKSYRFALEFSELRFTVVGKYLRDRFFCASDDHGVAVYEFPSEALGDDWSDRAFPGGHESGDDEFGRHLESAWRMPARAD
jgi:hypothetical protein